MKITKNRLTKSQPRLGGFSDEAMTRISAHEDSNFWFESRNRIILRSLEDFVESPNFSFLEIGPGTGVVFEAVSKKYPQADMSAVELFPSGASETLKKVPKAQIIIGDVTKLTLPEGFNFVGMFDVLEHIEDDLQTIASIHSSLATGGILLITVPQHSWLWSESDVVANHVRRYKRSDLIEKLQKSGFQIEKAHSFVSFLVPIMWLSRVIPLLNKSSSGGIKIPKVLDRLFSLVMKFEIFLISRADFDFPVGGSLLIIARKI